MSSFLSGDEKDADVSHVAQWMRGKYTQPANAKNHEGTRAQAACLFFIIIVVISYLGFTFFHPAFHLVCFHFI